MLEGAFVDMIIGVMVLKLNLILLYAYITKVTSPYISHYNYERRHYFLSKFITCITNHSVEASLALPFALVVALGVFTLTNLPLS